MAARWEHFEHQADIGVRGRGPTRESAFEQAALALTAVVADLSAVRPRELVTVHCMAPDDELLLCDWLNALVYEMAVRGMLFSRYSVSIDNGRLEGLAWGEPVDRPRHHPAVEVKGATLTALRVTHAAGEWLAECVVDV
ncbi:MAG TPA: archease [Gammaproteobacteria bacterium]|nr:archease [Gammaproteobacteria bacterium]